MDPLIKAAREYDKAAREATAQNKAKKDADAKKTAAKAKLLALYEEREDGMEPGETFDGVTTTIGGRKVTLSKYDLPHLRIEDLEAFKEWADQEDEEYFEPERRVRMDILADTVREKDENNEPWPPGVGVFLETKISRTTSKR